MGPCRRWPHHDSERRWLARSDHSRRLVLHRHSRRREPTRADRARRTGLACFAVMRSWGAILVHRPLRANAVHVASNAASGVQRVRARSDGLHPAHNYPLRAHHLIPCVEEVIARFAPILRSAMPSAERWSGIRTQLNVVRLFIIGTFREPSDCVDATKCRKQSGQRAHFAREQHRTFRIGQTSTLMGEREIGGNRR